MSLKFSPLAVLCGFTLFGSGSYAADFIGSGQFGTSFNKNGQTLPYLQCVPYARAVSGIQIYGDALTWWGQAEGRYARGKRPKVGAVMSFRPHGRMELGHVAAVSGIIDSRTVLLRHANWSEIDGRRGQIENDVRAVDVSPGNDWSQVRVWYAPIGDVGTTAWPVNGFIYPDKPGRSERLTVLSTADTSQKAKVSVPPISQIGANFLRGIKPEVATPAMKISRQITYTTPKQPPPAPGRLKPALSSDPIGRIIASRTK